MKIIIFADASPSMGTGHVMRCLALAQAAKTQGMAVRFASRITVPWVRERLAKEHISVTYIPGEVTAAEAAEDALRRLDGVPTPDWIIFDGYHFGPDCQKAIRAAGYKLLVIDDYAHLPEYCCDILLNQNIGADEFVYAGDIGKKLLGPTYALLRSEFIAARKQAEARQFPGKAKNILLTLGGGDFSEHLARIAPNFNVPELTDCTLMVIAGAVPQKRIRKLLQNCPAKVEIIGRVDDMPALLLDTDLCITAGGSTCWELCCLGVSFLVVEIAENQHEIVLRLAKSDMAKLCTKSNLKAVLNNNNTLKCYSELAHNMVDAQGSMLVLNHLNRI